MTWSALAAVVLLSAAPRLAAPGLKTAGVDAAHVDAWNEQLAQNLTGLQVTTARDIASVLGLERQKLLLGCAKAGDSCLAELASALGVDGIVLGDVVRVEGRYQISLKVVGASDGRVLSHRVGSVPTEAALFDALGKAGREMAPEVWRALRAEVPSDVERRAHPPSAARRWSWLPVVGGLLLAGAGAGLLVAAEDRYSKLATATFPDRASAVQVANSGKTLTGLGWAAVGVGACAVLAGVLMYFVGGQEEGVLQVWLGPSGGGLVVSGSFR